MWRLRNGYTFIVPKFACGEGYLASLSAQDDENERPNNGSPPRTTTATTRGVNMKQTVSFTRRAESVPEVRIR